MNQVILIGRLTKKPEQSFTQGGTCKATFTIAVDRPSREGAERKADFIRITVWGKQAESCARYLDKGRQVAVNGWIQTGSYEKDGRTIFTQDVVASRVEFLGGNTSTEPTREVSNTGDDFPDFSGLDLGDTFIAAEEDIPF